MVPDQPPTHSPATNSPRGRGPLWLYVAPNFNDAVALIRGGRVLVNGKVTFQEEQSVGPADTITMAAP
jgi:hypothetical protein